jgi:hypothetical protein
MANTTATVDPATVVSKTSESKSYYLPVATAPFGTYGQVLPVPYGSTSVVYGAPDVEYGYGYGTPMQVSVPTQVSVPVAFAPSEIRQTYVAPPQVSEVQINELLPFTVSPTYTIHNWVVRSNVRDRGALARHMLLAWRPEDLDYGSDVDTTSMPQVFLFTDESERAKLQNDLYRNYPEMNLQAYKLQVPVRISTHTFPAAGLIPADTLVLPGPNGSPVPSAIVVPSLPSTVETVQQGPFMPVTLPPEVLTGEPELYEEAEPEPQWAAPQYATQYAVPVASRTASRVITARPVRSASTIRPTSMQVEPLVGGPVAKRSLSRRSKRSKASRRSVKA